MMERRGKRAYYSVHMLACRTPEFDVDVFENMDERRVNLLNEIHHDHVHGQEEGVKCVVFLKTLIQMGSSENLLRTRNQDLPFHVIAEKLPGSGFRCIASRQACRH